MRRVGTTLLLALLAACGQTPGGQAPEGNPDTVVMAGRALEALVSVEPSGQETALSFAADASLPYRPGQILVAGVSAKTPNGLAPAEVTGVQRTGSGYEVRTRRTTLERAVGTGRAAGERVLEAKDITSLPQGLSVAGQAEYGCRKLDPSGKKGFVLNVERTFSGDLPGRPVSGSAKLQGCVRLFVNMPFNWDFRKGQLQRFDLGLKAELEQNLQAEFEATVGSSVGDDYKYTLPEIRFAPFPVMIGPVPVVVEPVLTITFGLDVNGKVKATIGGAADVSFNTGISYRIQTGRWRGYADGKAGWDFLLPKLDEAVSVEMGVSVEAAMGVRLYEATKLDLGVTGRSYVEGRPFAQQKGRHLTLGVELIPFGRIGMDISAFGYSLLKEEYKYTSPTLNLFKKELEY